MERRPVRAASAISELSAVGLRNGTTMDRLYCGSGRTGLVRTKASAQWDKLANDEHFGVGARIFASNYSRAFDEHFFNGLQGV